MEVPDGGDGGGWRLEQTPLSFASLILVAHIRLPETRSNGVVSMHECYTYFLSMFGRKVNVSLLAPGGRGG